jgi:hypothetical protein
MHIVLEHPVSLTSSSNIPIPAARDIGRRMALASGDLKEIERNRKQFSTPRSPHTECGLIVARIPSCESTDLPLASALVCRTSRRPMAPDRLKTANAP